MIRKDEIFCLKLLEKGPFFDEYVVTFACLNQASPYFSLRAMKKNQITLSKLDEDMVMFELIIRTNIRHPFLVNQIFAFQDYDILYYISEYAPEQILRSKILPKKFNLEVVKFVSAEVFSCLKYLHSKKQIYTFLCPKNLFFGADGHVKLNFSFCNCIEYNMQDLMDNVEYASYDYITNKRFTYLSDYWSLGIVMYEMLMGYTPFTGAFFDETIIEIKKCELVFSEYVHPTAKDFILMLVDKDLEAKYPTCQLLEAAIEAHPLFNGIDFTKVLNKGYTPPFTFNVHKYDLNLSPKLSMLYTTDFFEGDYKDGYGKIFSEYNTVNFLTKKRSRHKYKYQ